MPTIAPNESWKQLYMLAMSKSGNLTGAAAVLQALLESDCVAGSDGIDPVLLGAGANLALTRFAQGRLGEAELLARTALDAATARGWTSLLHARTAHLASALVHALRADWEQADAAIAAGFAAVVGGAEPPTTLWLLCAQLEVAVSRGRPRATQHVARLLDASMRDWEPTGFLADAAEHALTDAALAATWPGGPGPGSTRSRHAGSSQAQTPVQIACQARRRLAGGDHARARVMAVSATRLTDHETVLDLVAAIDAWLVIALADDLDHRSSTAVAAVQRAVELASPESIARPFLTTGSPRLRLLLARLVEEGGHGWLSGGDREAAFAAALLSRLGGASVAPESNPLLEPLTERELAMLHALPTMKSNAEIAVDAYVSVNTVKAHLKGLYRKLGVSSRRRAVERGRELGLLP